MEEEEDEDEDEDEDEEEVAHHPLINARPCSPSGH